tara:strand:- start:156 stop:395 length:240 start_codon:yes stop_codon:yes gene_type:complete
MFSFIFSIFKILLLFSFKFFKKFKRKKASFEFSRKNLYKWMNLTKKERYNLSKTESDNYLFKRKDLLEKIRKEYKTLKK